MFVRNYHLEATLLKVYIQNAGEEARQLPSCLAGYPGERFGFVGSADNRQTKARLPQK